MSKSNLSKHRHISFTAHYTGYIWYTLGISHTAFATSKGKMLMTLLRPLEYFSERFIGGSIRKTLEQRHSMIDQALISHIEKNADIQIVEIATGLSPRGWSFRQRYPKITFIEVDLPEMAATKQQALTNAGDSNATVMAVDLFTPQISTIFSQLDQKKPLIIISEGLVNYFSKDLLQQLWHTLAQQGQVFKEFYYLTDICPEPIAHPFAHVVWKSSQLLKVLSRSAFSFHFTSPKEVKDFLKNCGYQQISIKQPSQNTTDEVTEHLGDFVWFVHAQL